jgi:dienelactone hydrolase
MAVRHLPEATLRDASAESILFHIARLTFDLAFENIIQAAVVAHPSLFKPDDMDVRNSQTPRVINVLSISRQIYVEKSKAPLLINSCEDDEMFPKSAGEAADKTFANFGPGYRRTYYEGVSHGFAVRGDLVRVHVFSFKAEAYLHNCVQSKPAVKAAKEDAFKECVEWLIKYMQ